MLQELHNAFKPGVQSDMQTECVDIFFGNDHFWKEQFDIVQDGSDEETDMMIQLVLSNLDDALEPHIVEMLKDWQKFGF